MSDPFRIADFTAFLRAAGDGRALELATALYRKCIDAVQQHVADHHDAASATLTLKTTFTVDPKWPERVEVKVRSDAALPKPPADKDVVFAGDDGTPTLMDPGRGSFFPGANMGRRVTPQPIDQEGTGTDD